jgi:hypothetical protein
MKIRDYITMVECERQSLPEKAPPGADAERWIAHRKKEFQARYGKRWKQVLYAKAWKLFGR